MRPWLVGVGLAFAVLGGAVVTAFYLFPAPSTVQTESTGHPFTLTAPVNFTIVGLSGASPSFVLRWSSSGPASVGLYPARDCPTPTTCSSGSSLANWSGKNGGSWQHAGSLPFPLVLLAGPFGNGSITFSYTATTTVSNGPVPAGLMAILVDLAGAVLVVVGGLAIFLGLFLRGNPYAPRLLPPPASQSDPQRIDDMMSEGAPGVPRP